MQTQNKKNILYVGPYRQSDGWGQASKDYLSSLLTTHHNIHCQPIYMSNNIDKDISQSLISAENNYLNNYDTIIQHALPMMMTKTSLYNIGLLFVENQNFHSDSIYNLNLMDEIWVGSNLEKQSLIDGGVKSKISVVSHPIDTKIYKDNTSIFTDYTKDYYRFYFVGEYIQRKNLKDLIIAFHSEFDITENVGLVLKLSVPGLNADDANQKISEDIDTIKKQLRIKKNFHKDIIITDRLSNKDMQRLHTSCNCFVVTSYGEAFCRPAAEALLHGNYLISSSNIGILEYVESTDADIVDSFPQPVVLDNPDSMGFLDIYNANETWFHPNILSLKKYMRQAFENKKHITNVEVYKRKFSHKTIGESLCTLLR